jgi:hypothetical protein
LDESEMNGEHGTARGGAVLVFVVLLMLALVGMGHAVLIVSLAELSASRAAVRQVTSRTAAESGVAKVLRVPVGAWADSVPVGGVRPVVSLSLGRAVASGSVRRLGGEAWLVEGEGWIPGRAPERAARLAWSLDPLTRILALDGALTVAPGAPVLLAGVVDVATPVDSEPPLTDQDCASWAAMLTAHYTQAPLSAVALDGAAFDRQGLARLGLFDAADLLAGARPFDVVTASNGTPGPVERLGACATEEPWGWGDPDRPWRPCGTHLPLRVAPSDLAVVGGVGQGILLVDGDLTLAASARFYGLVLVTGTLRLEGGAALSGLGVARGGVEVDTSARVWASPCWAVRALTASRPALGGLVALEGVGPVGPL